MNCSTDEMRIRVGAELTAKTIQLMMTKICEKRVGRTVNTQRTIRIMKNVTISKTPILKNGRSCQNSGEIFQTQHPTSERKSDICLSQESAIYYHESLPLENSLEIQSNSGAGILEDPLQINTCQAAWTASDVDIDIKHERNLYLLDARDDLNVDNLVAASEFTAGTSRESASNFVKSEFGEQFGVTKFTNAQRTDESLRNTKTFICGTCGASFDSYSQLLIHDRIHMKEGCNSAVSKSMPKKTDTTPSKNNHTSSNTQRRSNFDKVYPSLRQTKCDDCGRILSTHSRWKQHVLQVHRKEHRFKCPFCDFGCQQKSQLESHKLVHSDVRNFTCHLCHRAFKEKKNLTQHLKLYCLVLNSKI